MARQIVWTKTAARQRGQVLQYWLKKNKLPEYPTKLIKLIAQRTSLLVQFPKSGKLTSFQEVRVSAWPLQHSL